MKQKQRVKIMEEKYNEWSKEQLLQEVVRMKSDEKRFGLHWEDKPESIKNKVIYPIIQKDKCIEGGDLNHLIFEGDNLHSLNLLLRTHKEAVDIIYIDPPYNTGNEKFRFKDDYVDNEDPERHSKWLSFMEHRLKLLQLLLAKNGVVFISIDDHEQAYLRLLCDKVFGKDNFITQLIWEKTQHFGRQKLNCYSNCEYVLVYAKKLYSEKLKELLVSNIQSEFEDAPLYNALNKEHELIFPSGKVRFNIRDGIYDLSKDKKYKLMQKIIVNNGINENDMVLRFKSRWSQATIDAEIIKGATFLIKSDNFAVRVIYGPGKTFRDSPRQIIFTNKNNPLVASSRFGEKVGTTEEGGSELKNIIPEVVFDYPKPTSLIKYLLSLVFDPELGNYNKSLTVLDCFAGSGTTGQAVIALNKEDDGDRKFILCQSNDEKEGGICESVTTKRIKYTTEKDASSDSLLYYKVISEEFDLLYPEFNLRYGKKFIDLLCIENNTKNIIFYNENYCIFEGLHHNYILICYSDTCNVKDILQKHNLDVKNVKIYMDDDINFPYIRKQFEIFNKQK